MKNKVVGSVVGCCLVGVGVSVGVRVSCCVWSRFHVTIINYHIVGVCHLVIINEYLRDTK